MFCTFPNLYFVFVLIGVEQTPPQAILTAWGGVSGIEGSPVNSHSRRYASDYSACLLLARFTSHRKNSRLDYFGSLTRRFHQQKTHFCLVTKVRFLNDVCLRQMMLATPNDVRYA